MIEFVLEQFGLRTDCKSTDLGNAGGFSGSKIWKIESPLRGDFCLKRWPQQFQDKSRIEWIHKILIFAHANGCPEIAQPITTANSENSFVQHDQTFWELSRWASGQTTATDALTEDKLNSAMEVLARFHQATARYFFNFAHSKKINDVRDQLLNIENSIGVIGDHQPELLFGQPRDWQTFRTLAPNFALDIARYLMPYSSTMFPVQPVIRDLRPDHLFFEGDTVTTIIDFGAMHIDTIACDLSRLLGGYFGDDAKQFQQGIESYSQHRPVYPFEREIVLPLNHASVILGIIQWLKWLAIDKIQFESNDLVIRRVHQLLDRFVSFTERQE